MSMLDNEMIQPGWTVVDANGEEIGKVVNAEGPDITVKKSGFMGGEVHVPRDSVAEVETGRVEINRAKSDLG
jgi:hypothetical protein